MKLSQLPNPRRRARRPPRAACAFTVVELVGVLAVVAIIAAFMAENIIEKMRLAAIDAERTSLASLTKTLEKYVVRTKSIPALSNLPAALAADLAVAQDRATHTAQGNPRWFWVDPDHRVGTNATSTLPFTQTGAGSVQPQKLRMVVISSVGTPLPTPAVSPDANQFLQAWNAVAGAVPAFLSSSWNGRPDDLNIQRLELGTLFCRVVLENLDANYDAWYSVDTTNTLSSIAKLTAPATSGRAPTIFWLVRGTVLNFHYPDQSLQAREYIMEDVGYTFENGRWGRYLRYGPNRSNGWFGEMVDQFLAAPPPPGATRRYSTQQWVIDAMYQFLYCFGQWSLDNFYGGPPWPHIPGYEQANAGATGLADYSSDLLITN